MVFNKNYKVYKQFLKLKVKWKLNLSNESMAIVRPQQSSSNVMKERLEEKRSKEIFNYKIHAEKHSVPAKSI